jgi:hypothetical protein
MARVHTIPNSQIADSAGNLRPEWRAYLQRLGTSLQAAAAVTQLDSGTTYSADQLRDTIIALQNALGAGD